MTCEDCGKEGTWPRKGRNICNECWELRVKLVRIVQTGKLSTLDFRKVQRRMVRGPSGTANVAMEAAIAKAAAAKKEAGR